MNKQVIEVLNKQVADWSVLFTKLTQLPLVRKRTSILHITREIRRTLHRISYSHR